MMIQSVIHMVIHVQPGMIHIQMIVDNMILKILYLQIYVAHVVVEINTEMLYLLEPFWKLIIYKIALMMILSLILMVILVQVITMIIQVPVVVMIPMNLQLQLHVVPVEVELMGKMMKTLNHALVMKQSEISTVILAQVTMILIHNHVEIMIPKISLPLLRAAPVEVD